MLSKVSRKHSKLHVVVIVVVLIVLVVVHHLLLLLLLFPPPPHQYLSNEPRIAILPSNPLLIAVKTNIHREKVRKRERKKEREQDKR